MRDGAAILGHSNAQRVKACRVTVALQCSYNSIEQAWQQWRGQLFICPQDALKDLPIAQLPQTKSDHSLPFHCSKRFFEEASCRLCMTTSF